MPLESMMLSTSPPVHGEGTRRPVAYGMVKSENRSWDITGEEDVSGHEYVHAVCSLMRVLYRPIDAAP